MSLCKIIALEGNDRVGKYTQAVNLLKNIRSCGYKCEFIEIPVDTQKLSYKVIYWMLDNGLAKKFPTIFQLAHFINKISFQIFELPKLLKNNDFLVFDRWSLSSLVYGTVTGSFNFFNKFIFNILKKPDFTFIFHCNSGNQFPVKREIDTFEIDNTFQAKVYVEYMIFACLQEKSSCEVINVANKSAKEISTICFDKFKSVYFS